MTLKIVRLLNSKQQVKRRETMKIAFENLGLIDQAEIELADLTIVCGENNTGKTYVTYLIYCLLKNWSTAAELDLHSSFDTLQKNGVVKIDLNELVVAQWEKILKQAVDKIAKSLPDMLSAKSELFKEFKLSVETPLNVEVLKRKGYQDELRSPQGTLLLTLSKPENTLEFEITTIKSDNKALSLLALNRFIEDRLLGLVFENIVPDVFIASTERTGATIFRKQLNLATGNLIELLSQAHKEGEQSIKFDQLFDVVYGRKEFAQGVQENVRFINQLPNENDETGELYTQYPELLESFEAIVGGKYVTTKEGVTHFQPIKSKLKLSLGEVSSSVRSLLIVWYWFKYQAKSGGMLIIDEPELNLHPANQRRLARFLVALINHGVKVFITTHSDYIVREFNTLIMLNKVDIKTNPTLVPLSDYSHKDRLDPAKVNLYMAQQVSMKRNGATRKSQVRTLVKADVNESLGIEVASFDNTIIDMNEVQNFIRYEVLG